jgi:RecA/RadA recombinase
LKYQYIPETLTSHKKVLQSIVNYWQSIEKLPTFGVISQQHESEPKILALIAEIKKTDIAETETILKQLEEYIKKIRFQLLMQKSAELYNEGRQDESIKVLAEESNLINEFSIKKDTGAFEKIFEGSTDRFRRRLDKSKEQELKEKIPFGIKGLDVATYGGIDRGELCLYIGRSGEGKSTFLRNIALHNAMLGYEVLHIQLEGGKEEAAIKYDQMWTNSKFNDIKNHNISTKKMQEIEKSKEQFLARSRDLSLYSFDKFDEASVKDVRELIFDFQKERGRFPDLLVIDYLELLHPGDGIKYGVSTQDIKMKITNTSRKLKNICQEFNGMRCCTATQTGDIAYQIWNDPQFVITRSNTKGDKNMIDPFSFVVSGNRTVDESKNDILRIYVDKMRNYPAGQTIKVKTDYEHGKFYVGEINETNQTTTGESNFNDARKKLKK